jgi:hypothetical protein
LEEILKADPKNPAEATVINLVAQRRARIMLNELNRDTIPAAPSPPSLPSTQPPQSEKDDKALFTDSP